MGAVFALALGSCNRLALDDPRVTCHVAAEPIRITMPADIRKQYLAHKERTNVPAALREWQVGTIQFGPEPAGPCKYHARGNNSMRSIRKSYSIKLPKRQTVLPGVKMRRVFLLNLASDRHEFEMRFAHECQKAAGVFSPEQLLTRVIVNDEDDGLYLLCERHHTAIRRAHPDTTLVVRCGVQNYATAWPSVSIDWRAVRELRRALKLEDVAERARSLDGILDVDAFVRWMACNSLLMNADTVDELFLFEQRKPGEKIGRFGVMGWDFDDLNAPPSHPERVLDHPLTWAAESDLEKAVLTTEPLLQRYRETLGELLRNELSMAMIDARLDSLRVALNAAEPDEARDRAMDEFRESIANRHRHLLEQLRD